MSNTIKWVGYRLGKKLCDGRTVYDDGARQAAQEIAVNVFKEEYHERFMVGYAQGFTFQAEKNAEWKRNLENHHARLTGGKE
jgi:hypothetical protein